MTGCSSLLIIISWAWGIPTSLMRIERCTNLWLLKKELRGQFISMSSQQDKITGFRWNTTPLRMPRAHSLYRSLVFLFPLLLFPHETCNESVSYLGCNCGWRTAACLELVIVMSPGVSDRKALTARLKYFISWATLTLEQYQEESWGSTKSVNGWNEKTTVMVSVPSQDSCELPVSLHSHLTPGDTLQPSIMLTCVGFLPQRWLHKSLQPLSWVLLLPCIWALLSASLPGTHFLSVAFGAGPQVAVTEY